MVFFMKMLKTLGINFILFSLVFKISSTTIQKCNVPSESCTISIPRINEPSSCKMERNMSVTRSRHYYKLTRMGETSNTQFPLPFIPFLNQNNKTIAFHTAMDPIDSKWLAQFPTIQRVNEGFATKLFPAFAGKTFTEAKDYIELFDMHQQLIKSLRQPKIFSNPAMDPSFTDFIHNNRYLSDELFIQQRLAGMCPFMIKLVTKEGNIGLSFRKLKTLLNPNFDFDAALQDAVMEGYITMEKAVARKRLYAIYHPELNDVKTFPDYFDKSKDLMEVTSPVSLYALTEIGDLRIVAIQENYKRTAAVYTPKSDSFKWGMAKFKVNSADANICQAMWHLSHLHFTSGAYCTIYKSHFSDLHPLYQIMRHHCEGTTPHIALTYNTLLDPDQLSHKVFSMTHKGFVKLTVDGHNQYHYGKLDYLNILESRGLNSKRIKYHPFRDDGLVIYQEFKKFANSFVNMFYESDSDVASDHELQSFAKQISLDGGEGESYGGKGNIAGFPHVFKKKDEVELFVTRFVWIIGLHSTINYPLEPWSSFLPLSPTKFYHSNNQTFASALPDKSTTIALTIFSSLLGNLRMNRIFDYYVKIDDEKLRKLVKRFHHHFFGDIQCLIRKRNEERKKKGQVTYPYLEPVWMTSSIHI